MERRDDYQPDIFATYWINSVSRQVQKRFEKRLRPLGFGLPYVGVATQLERLGALQQRDLAKYYEVEQPTMAALIMRMERDGLVSREPHPEDKRASLISLTAKAKTKLPKIRRALMEEANLATDGLTVSETKTLIGLLRKVAKHLAETGID